MIGETQPPGHPNCFGYVASYVTGEPFTAVADFIGHDGSERGFTAAEIVPYLLSRGYYYGHGISFSCFALEEQPSIPKNNEPYFFSETVLAAIKALGRSQYRHLQGQFDKLVQAFLAEHDVNLLPAAPVGNPDVIEGIKGKDGEELYQEMQRVGYVFSMVTTDQPAIITALVNRCPHALYWTGQKLFDPHHRREVDIRDYTVLQWKPVTRFV